MLIINIYLGYLIDFGFSNFFRYNLKGDNIFLLDSFDLDSFCFYYILIIGCCFIEFFVIKKKWNIKR